MTQSCSTLEDTALEAYSFTSIKVEKRNVCDIEIL